MNSSPAPAAAASRVNISVAVAGSGLGDVNAERLARKVPRLRGPWFACGIADALNRQRCGALFTREAAVAGAGVVTSEASFVFIPSACKRL